jgi:hypothetical protein
MDSTRCSMLSTKSTFMLSIYHTCIEIGWLKSTHSSTSSSFLLDVHLWHRSWISTPPALQALLPETFPKFPSHRVSKQLVPKISEGLQHCTTEQFDNDVDDDVALTPIELMEGLNANHEMGSELEAVEDESAWEAQEPTAAKEEGGEHVTALHG